MQAKKSKLPGGHGLSLSKVWSQGRLSLTEGGLLPPPSSQPSPRRPLQEEGSAFLPTLMPPTILPQGLIDPGHCGSLTV